MGQAAGTAACSERSNARTVNQPSERYLECQSSLLAAVKGNKILTAAAMAQTSKLAKLAAATPRGREPAAAGPVEVPAGGAAPPPPPSRPRTGSAASGKKLRAATRLSLAFVCAVLGHAEELRAVHDAWKERGFESYSWMVDSACTWNEWEEGTPLACAVHEGHVEVVRLLLETFRANPLLRCQCMLYGPKCTALHICISKHQPEVADMILSACDETALAALMCGRDYPKLPLDMALKEKDNMDLIEVLANPKWGTELMDMLDSKFPIAVYCELEGARPNVLRRESADTPFYGNVEKKPRASHAVFIPWELVAEMAKHGGLLPNKTNKLWGEFKGPEYVHIHVYLELYPSQIVSLMAVSKYSEISDSVDMLRASMPAMEFKTPSPNRFTEPPPMVSAAIEIDDSITSMLVQYQAETARVLGFLDIQSLGRIQQTSRFWYHVGRSNSSWKQVLLNNSTTWSENARSIFKHYMSELNDNDEEIKWKHVCFVWVSRNICKWCGKIFRNCDGIKCTDTHAQCAQHRGAVEHLNLEIYYRAYSRACMLNS
ncbi:hypothetical protein Pelo_11857 [Pelomyxa schiedti]|nr:hypothetical protein Pelo_11857 [Pelomyxa schiedti]